MLVSASCQLPIFVLFGLSLLFAQWILFFINKILCCFTQTVEKFGPTRGFNLLVSLLPKLPLNLMLQQPWDTFVPSHHFETCLEPSITKEK